MRRSIAAGLVLGAAVLHRGPAWAGDPDLERARALFEEAGELERHGNWSGAEERLRQALRLRETPQLHYALGWALENDDKLLEAKAEYETAMKQGQNRSGGEEATRLASARLADLEKKMPVIKVRVTGASKASARVIVDGKEVKRDDDVAILNVNPGSHVIRVERTGTDESIEQMAYVGRGTVRSVDVDTGAAVAGRDTTQDRHAPPPLRMSDASSSAPGDDLLPWVFVGAGTALVLGGIIVFAASAGDASTRDEMHSSWCVATRCNGNRASVPETPEAAAFRRRASDAADAGNTKQAIGIAMGSLGLAAGALGAYFFMTSKKTDAPRASVSPLPGGGYASAAFSF
ncbi:MAG: hypothetical protein KIT84_39945 [Labilithrix sp.]|nr:hypothetical protein [Labilithrix sp.]MCW5817238.1 hypothetical protein [Labilithrix sp.]